MSSVSPSGSGSPSTSTAAGASASTSAPTPSASAVVVGAGSSCSPAPTSLASTPSSPTAHTCTSTLPLGTLPGGARYAVNASGLTAGTPLATSPGGRFVSFAGPPGARGAIAGAGCTYAALLARELDDPRERPRRPSTPPAARALSPRVTSTLAIVACARPVCVRSTRPLATGAACAPAASAVDAGGGARGTMSAVYPGVPLLGNAPAAANAAARACASAASVLGCALPVGVMREELDDAVDDLSTSPGAWRAAPLLPPAPRPTPTALALVCRKLRPRAGATPQSQPGGVIEPSVRRGVSGASSSSSYSASIALPIALSAEPGFAIGGFLRAAGNGAGGGAGVGAGAGGAFAGPLGGGLLVGRVLLALLAGRVLLTVLAGRGELLAFDTDVSDCGVGVLVGRAPAFKGVGATTGAGTRSAGLARGGSGWPFVDGGRPFVDDDDGGGGVGVVTGGGAVIDANAEKVCGWRGVANFLGALAAPLLRGGGGAAGAGALAAGC